MVTKASNKHYPPLQRPLFWGKDAGKKGGLWIWCAECEKWVGWALVNWNTQVADFDPDGRCCHYTEGYKEELRAKALSSFR